MGGYSLRDRGRHNEDNSAMENGKMAADGALEVRMQRPAEWRHHRKTYRSGAQAAPAAFEPVDGC